MSAQGTLRSKQEEFVHVLQNLMDALEHSEKKTP